MVRVWGLTGARAGDNAQVVQLAAALGLEWRRVPLRYNGLRVAPNWLLGATLSVLTPDARSALTPPWPDLIIAAGRRSVPIARWIARRSGGRTRLVHLGRPRAPLTWFDLVVTTPQYGLPDAPNLVMMPLPLSTAPDLPPDAGEWRKRWSGLPQPLTAVLTGGSKLPYRLDRASLQTLVAEARRLAAGGSIIYASSPRTSAGEVAMLDQLAGSGAHILRWSPEGPNPYPALLATADRFLVTEDSVSMIADALATGNLVAVSPVTKRKLPTWNADHGAARWLAARGILTPPRNVPRLISHLARSGQISMPGYSPDTAEPNTTPVSWSNTIDRIKKLIDV